MIRKLLLLFLGLWFVNVQAQQLQAEEVASFKEECNDLVAYLEFTLNAIGDNDLSPKEKDIIISDSYAKFFRDQKVQIEDDLVPDREAVTNKDVQAYLKDVDFFFDHAVFSYNILSTDLLQNENNQPYFKVHALRTLSAKTPQQDSIYNEQARYIEIMVNPDLRELKIVSVYTTKINEKEENIKWWNDIPISWKEILGKAQNFNSDIAFSRILHIQKNFVVIAPTSDSAQNHDNPIEQTDSLDMNYVQQEIDTLFFTGDSLMEVFDQQIHRALNKIMALKELNISGKLEINNLEPVNKLTALQSLNISGTLIDDLYPIRNLIDLQDLNISHSQVQRLDALVYSMSLRNLNLSYSKVSNLDPIANLNKINVLNISHTNIDAIDALATFTKLDDLRMQSTMVSDMEVLAGLSSLKALDIDNCPISSLENLSTSSELRFLSCKNTVIRDLSPLKDLEQLSVLYLDNTEITSLKDLNNKEKLSKIYCDNTLLGKQKALDFMNQNPHVLVVYESRELQKWFEGLSPEWIQIFMEYVQIDIKEPSKEELHQLASIPEIDLSSHTEIRSLEPLSQVQNLKKLNISHTSVESIEPLYELRDLNWLDMSHTKVNSLSSLENNNSLDYLNISSSSIEDLKALEQAQSLNKLYMEDVQVSDIGPLTSLSGLRELRADNCLVDKSQFEAFILANPKCSTLYQTGELVHWWESLSEVWKSYFKGIQNWNEDPKTEDLHQLAKRKELSIENNRNIISIEELGKFALLKDLKITGTQVNDLRVLVKLQRLESIDLSQNPILNLEVLGQLPLLKSIDISDTQIASLDWVIPLYGLQSLDISGTQIKNLKALTSLHSLETLIAYNTRIANLKPIMELQNLKILKIYNTKLSSKKVEQFKNANPSCVVDYF